MSDETALAASTGTTPPVDTPDAIPTTAPQRDSTIREAQAEVDATILALGGYWPPLANLARLFEECGELARVVNQTYGPKPRKPDETAVAIHEELGDILYVTLALANDLGVDATAALASALAKARHRANPATHPSHESE
ncbi:MAG TPA: nucleotide pyrophosphohydrolase [Ktedonobacterales bacterium]|nr:nucleotide pyrophosphohydrolase [Ktedonobacterales bacterium]